MTTIVWTEDLSVGVAHVDQEHQELLRLLNDLADAVRSGRGKEVLDPTLAGLIDYTKGHFAREEQMLVANDYPDLAAHRQEHRDLIHKINDIQGRMKRGATQSLSLELLGILVAWLTQHIQETDRRYGVFLNGKGVF